MAEFPNGFAGILLESKQCNYSQYDGHILEEALLLENPTLLPQLLTALAATLQRLVLCWCALPLRGHSWVDVFEREASPLTKLLILFTDHQFPLTSVLSAPPTSKRNLNFLRAPTTRTCHFVKAAETTRFALHSAIVDADTLAFRTV